MKRLKFWQETRISQNTKAALKQIVLKFQAEKKNANLKANDNSKSCAETSKYQKLGGSSKDRDGNVEKPVTRGRNKVGYIAEKIKSF